MRSFLRAVVILGIIFCAERTVFAQSTFGTILGTVKDATGSVIADVNIKITNLDENTSRDLKTNSNGDYEMLNSKPGLYRIEATAVGFQTNLAQGLRLVARQTLRVDISLSVGDITQSVTVEGSAGVTATDTQTIASTLNAAQLMALPGNVRASDSTSPYGLIAMLPGVQADNDRNFSIQGSLPSQTQYSVDGISTTQVTGNGPNTKGFTSMESIAEFKVQGVGNNAEYGQTGDVTTISKSGTNTFHGDVFWYHQNRALDARRFGANTKPQKVANDLGVSGGGPVLIPKLYNGKNKTFFFGTFERYTFPRGKTVQSRVPTEAVRNGDFRNEGITVIDPLTQAPFPNNIIPANRINPVSKKFLELYPLPNSGDLTTIRDANYIDNRDNSYNSNQFDVRGDHYLTSKQSVFSRYSWLSTNEMNPVALALPSKKGVETNKLYVLSHNYTIMPTLLNEFRYGFSFFDSNNSMGFDGAAFTNSLGLNGLGPTFPFNGLTHIDITNIQSLNVDRADGFNKSHTHQFTDNLTWNKGRHTMKFGVDIRKMQAGSALGFLSGDNYGNFDFSGIFSNAPMGDLLLGYPNTTSYAIVKNDNDGKTNHYAFYAQDSYRASSRLTLEFGLRYEYHPSYRDSGGNIGNFDPSVLKSGMVIYPTGAEGNLAPGYLASFNACPQLNSKEGPSANGAPCTPVFSASQAGIPEGLRYVPKYRFLPRFGFAFRPFSNDKTVIRGGAGIYNVTVLGSVFYSLTGTLQSDAREFRNADASGLPTYQWPNISAGGTGIGATSSYGNAYFGTANGINFKDPSAYQWNFSIDRDLGWSTGLRVSYIGMRTKSLVWSPDYNQSYYSTEFYQGQPLSRRPFPNWGTVNTRTTGASATYNAAQFELKHNMKSGLLVNSTYTYASNLADNQGPTPGGFAGETGGGRSMDYYNRASEYGPVYATRRHRWMTTALYQLPVGKGRQFGGSMNPFLDAVVGGWQLMSSLVMQTGPYLTPRFSSGDPSGTGSGIIGRPQHPDRIKNGNIDNPTREAWVDRTAFVCPASPGWTLGKPCTIGQSPARDIAPIGRFGNSGVGVVTGPGTFNLSAGLSKVFSITERVKIQLEGTFTNVTNHVNLADPNLSIDSNNFGRITEARGADFGGSRTGQISARIKF